MIVFPEDILEKYAGVKPAYRKTYLILKDFIVQYGLMDNEKITEEAVAEALSISRTPVRTAFTQLREEGLLKIGKKSSETVSTLTDKELIEIVDLLILIEGKAAFLAAVNKPSDEESAMLSQLVEDLKDLSDKREKKGLPMEDIRDLSMLIHLMIAKLSGNAILYRTIVEFRSRIRPVSRDEKNGIHFSGFCINCVEHIVDAIQKGKPEQAEVWMRCYIENSKDTYCYNKIVD